METELKDRVCRVICKLSALEDLFSFYSVANDKATLLGHSISGLSFIISDCTEELRRVIDEPLLE